MRRRGPLVVSILFLLGSLLLPSFSGASAGLPPVPTRIDHALISIDGDEDFTAENGVTAGTGKPEDPYVIEGWRIVVPEGGIGIDIRDTTVSFVIRTVDIGPQAAPPAVGTLGVRLQNVLSAALEDSTLDDMDLGLYASGSRSIRITNTTFRIAELPLSQSGLIFDRTNDILVQAIEITGGRFSGISAASVSNLTLEDSNFYRMGTTVVWATDSTGLTFRRNAFLRNGQGISVGNATNLTVESNLLESNRDAIQLVAAQNITIVGNEILRSTHGGITLADDPRFPNPSSQVRVYHNRFVDNNPSVRDSVGSQVAWDDGYPSGGNHWSGFVTPDRCRGPLQDDCSNRDGIVDLPYTGWNDTEFLGHVDRYPLVRPFTDSRSPPTAVLSILPASGDTDTWFDLDASNSTDAEDRREFLEARWDFDGDLTFDTDWSLHLITTHRYPGPGLYHPRVEVRDTTGASSVSTATLVVDPLPIRWTTIAIILWVAGSSAAMGIWLWRTRRKARARPVPPTPESPR